MVDKRQCDFCGKSVEQHNRDKEHQYNWYLKEIGLCASCAEKHGYLEL